VVGQVVDAGRQQGNLHLRRSGICVMPGVFLHQRLFGFLIHVHDFCFLFSFFEKF
jgi:hypothetical protein